ncbi:MULTISPECIES: ABC transporter ATP-binding protein [Mammaliicoccus]|uniref:ABC transporter ATP-binding protein n=1 Tax=Mammaliicoccus fleurettii TaxID=150056 RepID=A0ABS5MM26_9STAP|nr:MULTISPECIES: ABC transporter ATP-binding protein [Mammaliicoccus]HCN60960.1 multidrug ABC transporter ATP-binding protein [Staphylococcus sp.]MBL0847209.1 ABC transporter ATP-binding protein [Mammaliicoccus fleurettii]MBS3672145.1 ABC transporter ATP-binding protein [Mammaliicoccus fleurettii]MBS3696959.1 ABC transporter ATP-binding protein [Mammaliicoccus fleurettii]RTX85847.1 ABC transporter ATP-binding protein [Mammaliicoccus fleurettii]
MAQNHNLTAKDQFVVLKRLIKYTFPFKSIIALAFLMLTISTVASIATPYLVKIFIDDYLTPQVFPENDIALLITVFFITQIVGAVATYWNVYLFQYLAFKVIQQLRIDAFDKIGQLGMRYYDKEPGGSIVSRLTNDTEAIVEMFIGVFASFLMAIFMVISSYVMMFILDFKLALMALVFVPIIILILALYRKYSAIYFSQARQLLSDLNAKLAESIEGMRIIQVFNQEKRLQSEFNDINDEHYDFNMKTVKIDGLLLRPAISMISVFAVIMILSYFGILSFSGAVTAGVVFAFVQYMESFFEPINQVSQNLNVFQQALVSASRVFKLIDNDMVEPKQLENKNYHISEGKVEFKNITFSYDGKNDVLKNISFTANPGETVALVGHTGSGKSSIINLFMRFYEYNQGEILIDNQSIKEIPKNDLKHNIGLVLQDAFIFYGTITSNIKLYHPTMTFEKAREAAEFVNADQFINKLPGKYDHQVIEKGSAFSSGERQLLAFARTIASDPKILILDEATANIDSETEAQIQLSLEKMRKGRTTLAIAHRLSTIQDADQILVLNKGEIVERGTHDELIKENGIYHKMYLLQNG